MLQTEQYVPGTTADYNLGVATVQQSAAALQSSAASFALVQQQESKASSASAASVAAKQQAVQDADGAVDQAVASLSSALQTMATATDSANTTLGKIKDDLASQQKDYKKVQIDAATAAEALKTEGKDGSDVCSASGYVGTDASYVATDESYVETDISYNSSDTITQAITTLQSAQSSFEQARTNAPNYEPSTAAPSSNAVAATLAAGQEALSQWNAGLATDLASAKKTSAEAKAIADSTSAATGC